MNKNNTERSQDGVYTPEPRVYELGYHILPTVDEGNLDKERDALVAIITKFNGMVIGEELPALIDLAYDMTKVINNKGNIFSQAYFGWIKFDLNPENIDALTEEVEAVESVLRSLVIKTVRENTIVSDQPYRLAKEVNNDLEDDSFLAEEDSQASEADGEVNEDAAESNDEIASDDLTKIEGIGPKIAEILNAASIKTFADLSASKVADIRDILEANKLSSHDPKTWSKQATLAKNEKWDKLAELQEELKGGK